MKILGKVHLNMLINGRSNKKERSKYMEMMITEYVNM